MPHVIYLHSALTQDRADAVAESDEDARTLLRYTREDLRVVLHLAEQDAELLPAPARNEVRAPVAARRRRATARSTPSPVLWPYGVVDALEEVDVDERDRAGRRRR